MLNMLYACIENAECADWVHEHYPGRIGYHEELMKQYLKEVGTRAIVHYEDNDMYWSFIPIKNGYYVKYILG